MQPSRKSIIELFTPQVRYVVPMFQRKYVWQADPQWQNLWEDIEEKAGLRLAGKPSHPHYLGALIVEGVRPASGNEVTRMLVIDGQQRLTTLQLLLCAFREIAREQNWKPLLRRLGRLLENGDQDVMENPDEEKYKIWPTKLNRSVFSALITSRSKSEIDSAFPIVRIGRRKNHEPRSNLVEAFHFFHEKIVAWLSAAETAFGQPGEVCATALQQSLNDDFFIIHLSLSESDDAQEIFYSLNSKATPLSQSDLMRSLIFMRAEKEGQNKDSIFDDYWGKLETDFWSTEIKRGGRSFSRLDVGLRNFLTAKTGALVDARRASEEYRVWITAEPPRYSDVRAELKDLTRHCDIIENYEAIPADTPPTDFRRVLRDFDVSTVMPLVLRLTTSGLEPDTLSVCLGMVESFIVRRAITGEDNKEYNKLFAEIVAVISGAAPERMMEALKSKLWSGSGATRIWPGDESVKEAVLVRPLYNFIRTPALRLLLERLEIYLRTLKTENKIVQSGLTIEHVIPQRWGEHWPLGDMRIPNDVVLYPWLAKDAVAPLTEAIRERNSRLQTLGNLTLLNNRANPGAANFGFAHKKVEYKNSVLRLNRHFDELPDWDEKAIQARGELFAGTICRIWGKPE